MIKVALGEMRDGSGGLGPMIGLGALLFAGWEVGLLSLSAYERWLVGEGAAESLRVGRARWPSTS